MSARKTKAWTCDVCGEDDGGHDHSWHCTWCAISYATADNPRSDTEPTLHEKCIGAEEREAQRRQKSKERSLMRMADRPCALVATGDCGCIPDPDTYGGDPDLEVLAWYRQEDGRDLSGYHDHSENAKRRAAEAEARAVYDALPKELYCSTCTTVIDPADVDDEPWYECGNCGEEFNRDATENGDHRCPSCNKFASRSDTKHCANCEGELEVRVAEEVSI